MNPMVDDCVDAVLARRIKECAAGRRLSPDFSDRLVAALRRRRRARRLKVTALIVVLVLVCGLFGLLSVERPTNRSAETALVATDTPPKETQSSGWMLLGFFRECFRRSKVSKKKEDE